MYCDTVESELGEILLAGSAEALCSLDFSDCRGRMMELLQKRWPGEPLEARTAFGGFGDRVAGYLAGDLAALDPIEVETNGSEFEELVWQELRQIPPGATLSYGELAERLGRPGAARAVGRANSQNPVALVVPCHRVIGGDGSLTGYAGGLERKQWLLRHEGFLI